MTSTARLALLTALLAPVAAAHGSAPHRGPADPSPHPVVAPPTNPGPAAAEDARLSSARDDLRHDRAAAAEATLRELLDDAGLRAETDREARLLLGGLLLDEGRADEAVEVAEPLDGDDTHASQLLVGRAYRARADALAARGGGAEDVGFLLELASWSLRRAAELATVDDTTAAVEAMDLLLHALGDAAGARDVADDVLARAAGSEAASLTAPLAELRLLRGVAGTYLYWDAQASGDEAGAQELWDAADADLRAALDGLPEDRFEPAVQLAWLGLQPQGALEQALADARVAAARGATGSLVDVAVVSAYRDAHDVSVAALRVLADDHQRALVQSLASREDVAPVAERLSFAVVSARGVSLEDARDLHVPLAAAATGSASVWNNYALLCRDTGAYEESYRAYRRALELQGPDPRLLNDTALVLHYHLMGDDAGKAAEARALYEQAIALAEERLAALDRAAPPTASAGPGGARATATTIAAPDADLRAELELALTDARNNLALLDAGATHAAR